MGEITGKSPSELIRLRDELVREALFGYGDFYSAIYIIDKCRHELDFALFEAGVCVELGSRKECLETLTQCQLSWSRFVRFYLARSESKCLDRDTLVSLFYDFVRQYTGVYIVCADTDSRKDRVFKAISRLISSIKTMLKVNLYGLAEAELYRSGASGYVDTHSGRFEVCHDNS